MLLQGNNLLQLWLVHPCTALLHQLCLQAAYVRLSGSWQISQEPRVLCNNKFEVWHVTLAWHSRSNVSFGTVSVDGMMQVS